MVNDKLLSLHGIRSVRLQLADVDAVMVVLNDQRTDGGYEKVCAVHTRGERF